MPIKATNTAVKAAKGLMACTAAQRKVKITINDINENKLTIVPTTIIFLISSASQSQDIYKLGLF